MYTHSGPITHKISPKISNDNDNWYFATLHRGVMRKSALFRRNSRVCKYPALITRESRTKYIIIRTARRRDEKGRNDGDDGGCLKSRFIQFHRRPLMQNSDCRRGRTSATVRMPREPYEDKKIVRYL